MAKSTNTLAVLKAITIVMAPSLTSSKTPTRRSKARNAKEADTPKKRTGKITLLPIKQQLQKKKKAKQHQAGSARKKNNSGSPALKWPPSDPAALQAAKEALKNMRIKTRSNPAKKDPRRQKNPKEKVFVVEAYSPTTPANRRPKERLVKRIPNSKC